MFPPDIVNRAERQCHAFLGELERMAAGMHHYRQPRIRPGNGFASSVSPTRSRAAAKASPGSDPMDRSGAAYGDATATTSSSSVARSCFV